jgi:hypothetical protein
MNNIVSFKFEKNYSMSKMMKDNHMYDYKSPVIMQLDRAKTASESFERFLRGILMFENSVSDNETIENLDESIKNKTVKEKKTVGIIMSSVGLKIEGKSSCYHLWYFINTKQIYAIDTNYDMKNKDKTTNNMIAKCPLCFNKQ